MTNKENVALDLTASGAYLYNQSDLQTLMVHTACVVDNSSVTLTTKGSCNSEKYTGSFTNWITNRLDVCDSGCMETVASNAPEITIERTPAVVSVTAGEFTYTAPLQIDSLGLNRIAAPYKATFKPIATRYELDADHTQQLLDTAAKLSSADKVYRMSGCADSPVKYSYVNPDTCKDLFGLSILQNGKSVCKYKTIKLFKLDNGFGVKLGNSLMISVTEASPKYKERETLFVKQQDPDTNRWYLEPVKVKISKGFNNDLKQFAYDVTMDNGNQLFDIPESDLFVEKIEQDKPKEWSHF